MSIVFLFNFVLCSAVRVHNTSSTSTLIPIVLPDTLIVGLDR